jgi:DNA-binding NarL/FixJ family response regulator
LKETGVLFLIPSADALVLDPFESLALTWGLLAEDCTPEELITAVLALHEGLIVANPILLNSRRVRRAAAGEPDQPGRMITDAPLTPRERDVLQQLALGLTNKQIAVSLKISEHTVKFHISSIYTKLDVLNRADAVRAGIASGLITI